MNTLVIGGGGFVGAYLIAELNAGGHRTCHKAARRGDPGHLYHT